eukprot:CAMPEP_0202448342 /NCGR_PEP_ID=MMETSP1360-20130828/7159_1 /ASSEMBLY_ACC=CAM_ASM_000848 /TAXON_ID=515479 /ORGANISM="Licmophora paradoxa, Strain CCMP2313" /LENGTH=395 /DNA_ID=CAMNT_0049065865 /DNA_START=41 /DNA_END=1228 /DNA_ORIENTATION=+
MKFFGAFLSMIAVAQAALPIYGTPKGMHKLTDIKADSTLGNKILSKARKLEQNDEIDFTWVAEYSIKFQGCHHISQWNEEADEDEDVRISTKRLIRFRLCPANYCSTSDAGGCSAGYGDYIIDMVTYLEAYYEAVENINEYKCEYLKEMVCACDDDDGKGDDFDEDICLYECYKENGNMEEICMDNNPYNDDEQDEGEQFQINEYVECAEAKFDNDNRRRLEDGGDQYYMGPYCSEQGGAIFLGLFTDDTCTTFADEFGGTTMYETLSGGTTLPYSSTSLVGMECVSCQEPEDFNNDGNDAQDEDNVIEMCEQIYQSAGKCESNLGVQYPNEAACSYMEGIKITRENGTVEIKQSKSNPTANLFIGLFTVGFILMSAYVYYLQRKLQRASVSLAE